MGKDFTANGNTGTNARKARTIANEIETSANWAVTAVF